MRCHAAVAVIACCIFFISVDPPKFAPLWVVWAWKGIPAVAAYVKGRYEEKPE